VLIEMFFFTNDRPLDHKDNLNYITNWTKTNGFNFSTNKTKVMIFTKKRKIGDLPELFLNGSLLEYVKEHKFLGMILDNKLNWKKHIQDIKTKTKLKVNLLKILSHKRYGSDRKSMLRIHKTILLTSLEYGNFLYDSACKTTIDTLEPIHNAGIRLCTGAFRASSVFFS
jgi:hypothetical protein